MSAPVLRKVSLREIYKCIVLDVDGKKVGVIDDVLFHPTEPRAVGYSVTPTRIGKVIKRSDKYLSLDATDLTLDGEIQAVLKKDAWNKRAEKQFDFAWDDTVIWYGQHIHTIGDEHLGRVSDALFSLEDGSVGAIEVTDGSISDVTLGKRTIPVGMIERFDLDDKYAIVVKDEAARCIYHGGLAVTAAHVTDRVQKAAKVVVEQAPVVAKATPKVAAKIVKAAPRKTGRWIGELKKNFKEGYDEGLNEED
ncbi:MAG: PRC-barrel domain-containing protein [Coriobacteriia bacterium]|nr:PRC-barrel domain-containing protein [Coriobacteriia bacterium]